LIINLETDYLDVLEGLLGDAQRAEERTISTFVRVCSEILDELRERTISTFVRVCSEMLDELKNGLSRRSRGLLGDSRRADNRGE